jgi:hypothetical protein
MSNVCLGGRRIAWLENGKAYTTSGFAQNPLEMRVLDHAFRSAKPIRRRPVTVAAPAPKAAPVAVPAARISVLGRVARRLRSLRFAGKIAALKWA